MKKRKIFIQKDLKTKNNLTEKMGFWKLKFRKCVNVQVKKKIRKNIYGHITVD